MTRKHSLRSSKGNENWDRKLIFSEKKEHPITRVGSISCNEAVSSHARELVHDLRACSGQLGCRKKGFSKRCAVSLERDACGVAVVAHARACGRRGVGRARMGRGGGYAAAALERRVAPGKRMRGRLHDPASAHATSSPANSRDNLLPPRIESCVPPSLSRFHSSFLE